MRVLTLTGNLLAETTYSFDQWSGGATQRAKKETFQVGGKGINVTHMLTRLGVSSEALCFPGGATGSWCESWLQSVPVPYRAFRTTANTRTGAVVRAPGCGETTFLGAENNVDPDSIRACAGYLDSQPDDAVLAICGSIPLWGESKWDPLRDVLKEWSKRRVLIVDTYGPPLSWCAALAPLIIKINRHEFAGLAGVEIDETSDDRMSELLVGVSMRGDTEKWVVTDGPNVVWFCEKGSAPGSLLPPKTNERSQTGSGDVFLAGIIHAILAQGRGLKDAVEFALPLAAANAASEDVATFDLAPFGF